MGDSESIEDPASMEDPESMWNPEIKEDHKSMEDQSLKDLPDSKSFKLESVPQGVPASLIASEKSLSRLSPRAAALTCGGGYKAENRKTSLPVDTVQSDDETSSSETGRYLKNPLPVPKRRPHTRMEFDLTDDWDMPGDRDDFDIEIAEDDDFDIP